MAVVALFAVSCVTDTTNDLAPELGLESIKGETTLAISLKESRTHLGEKVDDLYQLHWSEGDMIAVNGTPSYPLTAEAAGTPNAVFSFDEPGVTRPYYIVYPAPAVMPIEEGEPAEGEGEPAEPVVPETPANLCPVTFLGVQTWEDGTFCEGAAPMYGYAKALGEDEAATAIQLQHLAGVLRIAPKGTVVLKSITVKSESGAIAGPFMVDCLTGKLTAQEGSTNIVTVDLGAGLSLDPAVATPIYVTVPNGNYGTFLITLHTDEDRMTVKFSSDVKPIAAGVVREFGEFTYSPNTLDSENADFLIDSEEALVEFARIASTFYPRASAKVVADINMANLTEEQLKLFPIKSFGAYSFDGGSAEGYTISNLTTPLFETTAAHIKNLKLTDVNIVETKRLHVGAVACDFHGTLENCEATGTLVYNNTEFSAADIETTANKANGLVNVGGMIGQCGTGVVKNSTNYVNVVIKALGTEEIGANMAAGGIAGGAHTVSEFINAINRGNVTIGNPDGADSEPCAIPSLIHVGGVLGRLIEYTADHYVKTMTGCYNYGTLSTTKNFVGSHELMMAGMTPRMGSYIEDFSNNHNHGTIAHNGTSTAPVYLAGMVSYRNWSAISGCTNNAPIYCAGQCSSLYIGGILGQDMSHTITDCTNNAEGKLYMTADCVVTYGVNIGGIAGGGSNADYPNGHATKREIPMKNCHNYAEIYSSGKVALGETDNNDLLLAGVIAGVIYNTIEGCTNTGNIYFDGTLGDGAASDNELHIGGITANTPNAKSIIKGCTNSGKLENKGIHEKLEMGGIVANGHSGTIENCTNSGDICTSGAASKTHNMAGIAADGGSGVIKGCTNTGDVYISAVINNLYAGGISTYSLSGEGEISGCTNEGDIYVAKGAGSNTTYLAGILAVSLNGAEAKIDDCTNSGNIYNAGTVSKAFYAGGLVGGNVIGTLTGSTNSGEVKNIGTAKSTMALGGIVGNYVRGTISGCNNTGLVSNSGTTSSTINLGGIIAGAVFGTISDCENSGEVVNSQQANAALYLGGIAGNIVKSGKYIFDKDKGEEDVAGTVTGCNNSGPVSNSGAASVTINIGGIIAGEVSGPVSDCDNSKAVSNSGDVTTTLNIGGIVGGVVSNTITDCENSGAISNSGVITDVTGLGGIVGSYVTAGGVSGCTNKGTLTHSGEAKKNLNIGGVVAMGTKVTVSNCHNEGAITHSGKSKASMLISGIVNNNGDYCDSNGIITGCTNKGAITVGNETTAITGRFYVAGISAYTKARIDNCENKAEGDILIQNITTSNTCFAGGITAQCHISAVDSPENKWENNHNKGDVALKKITTNVSGNNAMNVGGLAGNMTATGTITAENRTQWNNCTNEGKISTEDYASNVFSSKHGRILIAGCFGTAYAGWDFVNCHNKGEVDVKVKMNSNVFVGGLMGYWANCAVTNITCKIENCSNSGAITATSATPATAATSGGEGLLAGGIIGQTYMDNAKFATQTMQLTDVSNTGAIKVAGNSFNDASRHIAGGIAAYYYTYGTFTRCHNAGSVTFEPTEGSTAKTVRVAGITADSFPKNNTGKETHLVDCTNFGDISVKPYTVASGGTLYAGGLVGAAPNTNNIIHKSTNSGNKGVVSVDGVDASAGELYVGGLYGGTAETTEMFFGTNVNIGDVKVTNTTVGTKNYIGGIIGSTTIKVSGAKCYCDIQAPDGANRGWIMGTARTSAITATDCGIKARAGMIYDEAMDGYIPGPAKFNESTFFNFIYGGTTDWAGVENYDGCYYLETDPTVEKVTAPAAPEDTEEK